jgi:hypothetical protein
VKTISIDNRFCRTVGELDDQSAVIIYIKRPAFGHLLPGYDPDLSL